MIPPAPGDRCTARAGDYVRKKRGLVLVASTAVALSLACSPNDALVGAQDPDEAGAGTSGNVDFAGTSSAGLPMGATTGQGNATGGSAPTTGSSGNATGGAAPTTGSSGSATGGAAPTTGSSGSATGGAAPTSGSSGSAGTTPSSPAVSIAPISGNLGLTTVMAIASHSNLFPLLYIVGRHGPIKYIDVNVRNDTGQVFIDLSQGLFTGQDSGVMNLVFHPEYGQAESPNRNYFYVFYVADGEGAQFARVSRFTATEGQNSANRNTEQILIQERLPAPLHLGSGMAFGSDGFLYIGLGDYGNPNNGQDITEHLAAGILRIDVDQNPERSHPIPKDSAPNDEETYNQNYFIPNDNPFVGQAGVLEEYYALGERNPHRLTMDRHNGRMFVGNVGGNDGDSQEEVNEVIKGANYGWPFREGDRELGNWSFGGFQIAGRPNYLVGALTEPNLFYERPSSCPDVATQCPDLGNVQEGKCVIGGYVYRGSALFPQLAGRYLLSDCTSGKIWAAADDRGHGPLEELLSSPFIEVVTFGEDHNGEIYIGGTAGQIFRLEPVGGPVGDP